MIIISSYFYFKENTFSVVQRKIIREHRLLEMADLVIYTTPWDNQIFYIKERKIIFFIKYKVLTLLLLQEIPATKSILNNLEF